MTDSQPPESFVEYALEAVRRELRAGALKPGERVAADALARRLSISHIPVREALRVLEAEGQLVRDQRRLIVATLSAAEAEDIYVTRELLEREAITLGVPRLTGEDHRRLTELVDDMEAAATVGDQTRYNHLTRQFHFLPFEKAGRPWVVRFLRILWDSSVRYQRALFAEGGWRAGHVDHHRDLLAALIVGDVDRVDEILSHHRHWLIAEVRRIAGHIDAEATARPTLASASEQAGQLRGTRRAKRGGPSPSSSAWRSASNRSKKSPDGSATDPVGPSRSP